MYFGFSNISIKYGSKEIISNLTLEFERGKIFTIIGQNGCGKSSLLKTVSKAVTPSSGEVIYKGVNIRKYNPKELAQKIAYLPQVHSCPSDIDVRTLVSYGRYPTTKFGKSLNSKDTQIIDEVLELTGISHLQFRSIGTLSGGERQRAWIAMTLCQQPEILLLDEPTTYLDVSYQIEVLELIKELNSRVGLTIIMVLHDINLAARYSHKLFAIRNCSICAHGCPNTVLTKSNLNQIFDIEAEIYRDKSNDCPYFIPIKKTFHLGGEK